MSFSATEEGIRVRAYFLSLERDGRPADPLGDWLRAERELTEETSDDDSAPVISSSFGLPEIRQLILDRCCVFTRSPVHLLICSPCVTTERR